MTGVRRILDNAADRALAAGPPTKAQEAWYAATWAGTGVDDTALGAGNYTSKIIVEVSDGQIVTGPTSPLVIQ